MATAWLDSGTMRFVFIFMRSAEIRHSPTSRSLIGKYSRADLAGNTDYDIGSRKPRAKMVGTLSERNLPNADTVREIATELGTTPAQVALAWLLRNLAVTAPIIGARTLTQLEDNLGALDLQTDIALGNPHDLLTGSSTNAHSEIKPVARRS